MSDSAFARIYDAYVQDVYGFIGYRVRSTHVAEDLTQLTFERALRAWRRFDPDRASVRTWLLAISRNLIVDHHRKQREHPTDDTQMAALAGGAQDAVSIGPDPELAAALATLSDRDRELLALRFGGGLTGPEIAELTGLTLGNVQQILSRSLRRLRDVLSPPAQLETAAS
jgi:RNA polymerase sigma-70 factor, ECF subfamily